MKYTYFFGGKHAEGDATMRELLGGKGANLAEMARIGLPVPAGFTITTEVCQFDFDSDDLPTALVEQVEQSLKQVEETMGTTFGDPSNPLLLSIRSGARTSMPGMMDTVLNLGLNEEIAKGFAETTGNPRFVYDCYRRLIQMYGDVVLEIKPEEHEINPFEALLEAKKKATGATVDLELSAEALQELIAEYKALVLERHGQPFPDDPKTQLWGAIRAVFRSWNNDRAFTYRALNGIPDHWGTAVNVQAMVYGNRNERCGTGVGFTRDPAMGEARLYGEFLMNAQGEDVVAGIRTPQPLTEHERERRQKHAQSLEAQSPTLFGQMLDIQKTLEEHFGDMQDFEFTIEEDKLWLLQTRTGKRNGLAAVRIAVEMVEEGRITPQEALQRIHPEQHFGQLLQPVFDREERQKAIDAGRILATGLPAGPGAATGNLYFSANEAERRAKQGEAVILARIETSPEDIKGIAVSAGILTARGGATSHAALVARQMGKVCVAGCEAIEIDYAQKQMKVGEHVFKAGDAISLDGFEGLVLQGHISTQASEVAQVLLEKTLPIEDAPLCQLYNKVMTWANEYTTLDVKCNADRPEQVKTAIALGAKGVGLCRTEHMFFEGTRIDLVREMILAQQPEDRQRALDQLQPHQEEDFRGIFEAMQGHPVTIRLLDPPLHEFVPSLESIDENPVYAQTLADHIHMDLDELKHQIEQLQEFNPMLGHRGCRLLLSYPEITKTQTAAIVRAACEVEKSGTPVQPKIMVPLVSMPGELETIREHIEATAQPILEEYGSQMSIEIGSMLETPRACLTAGSVAAHADFFSFGTNDLTQMTYGFSRDDSGRYIDDYQKIGLLKNNPFQVLDQQGVGALMKLACENGRAANNTIDLGICGEHGGEPSSVHFCHGIGLHSVSCSPFRVPIAILAAAQANLKTNA
ncbi:MAG: pyruvate, phosphate dikinase [Deltaproteobacteria bacterium]|nr:pyruvate, phosphate dikinase [Deltaproteobacteria bacterium]|tara:strand:+ start:29244 stop:32003 length:2760 start_codon:yes stop_codon:yes gene_type:complete